MSEIKALTELLALIRDDGYAISFQSLGQYRVALANEIKRQVRGLDAVAVTGNAEPKLHYYSLAYQSGSRQVSVYPGFPDQSITLTRIRECWKGWGFDRARPPVLLSCCYLGYMTRAEMNGAES